MFNLYVKIDGKVLTHGKDLHFDKTITHKDGKFYNLSKEDITGNFNLVTVEELADVKAKVEGNTLIIDTLPTNEYFNNLLDNLPLKSESISQQDLINAVTPRPIIEMPEMVNEETSLSLPILNYNSDAKYYVTTNLGTYDIDSDGNLNIDVKEVKKATPCYIKVSAEESGKTRSFNYHADVIVNQVLVYDQAIVNDEFDTNVLKSRNTTNTSTSILSTDKDACYIENVVTQEDDEDNWTKLSSTTINYIPMGIPIAYNDLSNRTNLFTKNKILSNNIMVANGLKYNVVAVSDEEELSTTKINSTQASDANENDYFGNDISINNDGLAMVVGAPNKDDAGAVYTYKRSSIDDEWSEVVILKSDDSEEGDQYGSAVALSEDGLTLAVGAINNDTAASDGGKVYIYKRMTINEEWALVTRLTSSDVSDGDHFGSAVSLSNGGLVLVVGANNQDTGNTDAGKVYTYKRATIDDDFEEVSKLSSSDSNEGDHFGSSTSLTSDGLFLVAGAYGNDEAASNAGKVYIYTRNTIDDDWTEISTLTANDAEDNDNFGWSVALSDAGNVLAVGARYEDTADDNAGKVYIYTKDKNNNYTLFKTLTDNDASEDDQFGSGVSLSNDGLVLAVSSKGKDATATNAGMVYDYKYAIDGYKYTMDSVYLPEKTYEEPAIVNLDALIAEDINTNRVLFNNYINILPDSDKTTLKTDTTIATNQEVIINGVVNFIGEVTEDNGIYTADITNHELLAKPLVVYYRDNISIDKDSATTTEYVGYADINDLVKVNDIVVINGNTKVKVNDVTIEEEDDRYKYTITVPEQDEEIDSLLVIDNTIPMPITSQTYNGDYFKVSFIGREMIGNNIIRKISLSKPNNIILPSINSNLYTS